jgi:hypothetical protein
MHDSNQTESSDSSTNRCLVTASSAARGVSSLRGSSTLFGFTTLDHHLCEVDVTTGRILVESLTRVVAGGIWGVSEEGLERVEVGGGTCGSWVPDSVDLLLVLVVPHKVVELSVSLVDRGGDTGECWGRGESRSGGNNGEDGSDLVL